MVFAHGHHPRVNEEVLHLFGRGVNGVKFVRLKQGIGEWLGLLSELVHNGGDDIPFLSRLLKLPRTEEVCSQDSRRILQSTTLLVILVLPIEVARNTVRNCRLAGSRLASQPKDRWTVGRGILCPCVDSL